MSPKVERLRLALEGVLLDAGANGVEWSTELDNTTDALVKVVREWVAAEESRADALRSYHPAQKWNTELDGPSTEGMSYTDKDILGRGGIQ